MVHTHTHINTHTHTHTHTHTRTHTPKSVQGSGEYKTLRNFNIQTDKVIEYRLPDIVCINKGQGGREWQIIDFAIPGDQNIAIKEQEKIDT